MSSSELPRLASRTLRNLDFVKGAAGDPNVHPVTQVVNSLLALLVFPFEKEKVFFARFAEIAFPDISNLVCSRDRLADLLSLPSLEIVKFGKCRNLGQFFERIRNAISHKHVDFTGSDPDSRILKDVKITLKDCRPKKTTDCGPSDFFWEISMTAEDLEKLARYVANEIISQHL